MVSPLGFSLASFFHGACWSDSHFDGSLLRVQFRRALRHARALQSLP